MEDAKKWWASRGVIGSLATVAIGVAGSLGVVTQDQAAGLADQTTELLLSLGALVTGAISLWGRIAATRRIQ